MRRRGRLYFDNMTRTVRFDPRDFISPPFFNCPNCTKSEFGTLMISKYNVTRRCRACWHTVSERLPAIKKKLVYLDQMAYSGMAKTFDPVWAATVGPQHPFWAKMFDAVERAFKLQLIVCPESTVHEKESALASQPTMMRRLYEHLAGGVSFQFPTVIHQHQLGIAFRAVLNGQAPTYELRRGLVIHGDPDEWSERLHISVNMAGIHADPKTLRGAKDRSHAALTAYFQRWQTERRKCFDDWYREERRGHAVNFMLLHNERVDLVRRVFAGEVSPTSEVFWNPRIDAEVVFGLIRVAESTGLKGPEAMRAVENFLFSDAAYDAPANDISAMLLAALARKAVSGQKRPPSAGMWNDITAIATFLPYCDAMFLDNECAGLLREEPLRSKLGPFETKVYSAKSGEDFLAYLADLETQAGVEHVVRVAAIYGENWSVPYRELLVHERQREERRAAGQ